MLDETLPNPWPIGAAPDPSQCSEPDRLAVLGSYEWETLHGDEELARIAQFAARLCDAPSAAVSLVEAERQVFIAQNGMAESETPRSTSLCSYAMMQGGILEIYDCSKDDRFAHFAAVTGEAQLRFYAGAPLISSEGAPLGALCVTDTKPRAAGLTDLQREGLEMLAMNVKRRIEAQRQSANALSQIQSGADRLQFMLDSVPDIAWSAAPGPHWDYFNARHEEVTGQSPPQTINDWRRIIHPEDFEASLEKFGKALDTASAFADEWRLRQADGSYRWVISRAVPSSNDPATARWFGTLTDINDRYRISQERELLAGELAHRIKNMFAVITGLITLRARSDEQNRSFGNSLVDNILALSRAQDFTLQSDGLKDNTLKGLISLLMEPYGLDGANPVEISGDSVVVGGDAATPLAMIFHELATNSAKYGAFTRKDGRIVIDIRTSDKDVIIQWRESGGQKLDQDKGAGFGTRLIEMSVNHQLNGSINRVRSDGGLLFTMTLPRDRLEPSAIF